MIKVVKHKLLEIKPDKAFEGVGVAVNMAGVKVWPLEQMVEEALLCVAAETFNSHHQWHLVMPEQAVSPQYKGMTLHDEEAPGVDMGGHLPAILKATGGTSLKTHLRKISSKWATLVAKVNNSMADSNLVIAHADQSTNPWVPSDLFNMVDNHNWFSYPRVKWPCYLNPCMLVSK